MTTNNIKHKQGFTIIEVVLVLAIAGLIFLMVFVALPALQRSQRDTQRRNDVARAVTAIQNYQANNNHKIPEYIDKDDDTATFIADYLTVEGDTFTDPAGDDYRFFKSGADSAGKGWGECERDTDGTSCTIQAPADFKSGKIIALKNATCDGEKAIYADGASRIAFLMKLEGTGTYCAHN